jgi:hypothetical protein
MGNVDRRDKWGQGRCGRGGLRDEGIHENSVLSAQFCCAKFLKKIKSFVLFLIGK